MEYTLQEPILIHVQKCHIKVVKMEYSTEVIIVHVKVFKLTSLYSIHLFSYTCTDILSIFTCMYIYIYCCFQSKSYTFTTFNAEGDC